MSSENILGQTMNVELAFAPVDMGAAANNGDWINMGVYRRVVALLVGAAGTAGQDPVFTLEQAKNASGLDAKALPFDRLYEKVGTLASVAQFTRKTQAAAGTYTNDASAEAQKIIGVEIDAMMLDVNNGFRFMRLSVPDTGAAAQLGCGLYLCFEPLFGGTPPPDAKV